MDDQRSDPTHVAVVVNPERTDLAEELLERLAAASANLEVERVELETADDLVDAIADAAARGADVVAAVGGDGTQRAAATALRGSHTALVVVPGGTVNLLGQVLGIHDVGDSVRAVVEGVERQMDLGLVDGSVFVMNASTGFDATVMHRVDDDAKQLGRLGYFITGLRTFRADRTAPVVVRVDGADAYRGRAMTVMVANIGQRASAEFTVVPDARPDDGRIDVLIHRRAEVASLARALMAVARGRRPLPDDVVTAQGTQIEVTWGRPVWSQCDGDARAKATTTRYGVDPGALRVRVPPSAGAG